MRSGGLNSHRRRQPRREIDVLHQKRRQSKHDPQSAEVIPELKEAYTQAATNTWSQEELDVYEYWQIRDAADRYGLEAKFEKGFAQGIEQGVEKGKVEGKIEGTMDVARNMLGIGLSVEVIMQATGLSREQIAGLKE